MLVVYRIIGYRKHGVLGYGKMNVSWGQQYMLWPTCQGDHIRWLHKGCEHHLLTLPTLATLPTNQPSLHHHRSLEHFGHISATFPTIFSFFCRIEQRKCISRYHWVSSSICESLRDTSSSATFQQVMSLGFMGTINRRSSSSWGSSKGKDCYRAIKHQATSKH